MRNKILIVFVLICFGTFVVFKKAKNRLAPMNGKGSSKVASSDSKNGSDGAESKNAGRFSVKPLDFTVDPPDSYLVTTSDIPSGNVDSKTDCDTFNRHMLCRLFKLEFSDKQSVSLDDHQFILKDDISESFKRAGEILGDEAKNDVAKVWLLALGIYFNDRSFKPVLPYTHFWKFFGTLENSSNGTLMNVAHVTMLPDGIFRFTRLAMRKMAKIEDSNDEFFDEAKKFVRVEVVMKDSVTLLNPKK